MVLSSGPHSKGLRWPRNCSQATNFFLGMAICSLFLYISHNLSPQQTSSSSSSSSSRDSSSLPIISYKDRALYRTGSTSATTVRKTTTRPLTDLPNQRKGLGSWLEKEGYKIGAELGVQTGIFANETLAGWPSCEKYYLINLWRQIPEEMGYVDIMSKENDISQSRSYWSARKNLEPYRERTKLIYMAMIADEAVEVIPDGSLDYLYMDAHHDYCGVMEDLNLYWPKVKEGGVLAGHDYVYAHEVHGQDWTLCRDGTKHPGSVKGAVNQFAANYDLQVEVIYGNEQPSWILRKPNYGGQIPKRRHKREG